MVLNRHPPKIFLLYKSLTIFNMSKILHEDNNKPLENWCNQLNIVVLEGVKITKFTNFVHRALFSKRGIFSNSRNT